MAAPVQAVSTIVARRSGKSWSARPLGYRNSKDSGSCVGVHALVIAVISPVLSFNWDLIERHRCCDDDDDDADDDDGDADDDDENENDDDDDDDDGDDANDDDDDGDDDDSDVSDGSGGATASFHSVL